MKNRKYSYIWQGTNKQGVKMNGEITAFSNQLAVLQLMRKNIAPSFIKKKNFLQTTLPPRITHLDITVFFRQLAALISANIPLSHAIHVLSQNQEHQHWLCLLQTVHEDIAAGKEFSASLRKFPRYFDTITCHLIENGEKTGTLDIVLERIAHHKEKMLRLKNTLYQALFYPCTILLVALIIMLIMLTWVVPRFAELYHNMHSELPYFTRHVILISDLLRHHFSSGCLGTLLISSMGFYSRQLPRVKMTLDWLLLKSPPVKKIILARFSRHLATLFAAGIPIAESLNMLTFTTGNCFYKKALQKVHQAIATGKQFHSAITLNSLFLPMMVQMVQIGEESGTLETMLLKVAEFYEADIDRLAHSLNQLLEPLIMIVLGVLIGGLVIAMYLPIFKLGTVI